MPPTPALSAQLQALVICTSLALGCKSFAQIGECAKLVEVANAGLKNVAELSKPAGGELSNKTYGLIGAQLADTVKRLREAKITTPALEKTFTTIRKTLLDTSGHARKYARVLERREAATKAGRSPKTFDRQLTVLRKKMHKSLNEHRTSVRRVNALCQPHR